MCVCFYVCMRVCVFACAYRWLGGMEGIPCFLLCKRKDFGAGEQVPGFHAMSNFRGIMCVYVFIVALFHGYVKPVFIVGKTHNRDKGQTQFLSFF